MSAKDVQKIFLQSVLSRGVLSEKLTKALWEKSKETVLTVYPDAMLPDDDWNAFLAKVNKSIDPLEMELKQMRDETTGRDLFAMVNLKDDAVAQLATEYTAGEIVYFKALVEQIMLAPRESYSISSLAALREVSSLKPKSNMSKTQAEVVLGSFVANGWFLRSKRGRYSLSPRSLLELEGYLKNAYPDEFLTCELCKDPLTRGYACKAANCTVRMHAYCFTRFMAAKRAHTCPGCGKDWREAKDMTPVGEAAVRDGEDGKRRVRRVVESGSDEEPDAQESEEEEDQLETSSRKDDAKEEEDEDSKMQVDEEEEEEDDTPKAKKSTRGSRRK
ncbi:Non-structural maintenance of chromosomes element 1 [Mycena kentingensis (nom. inval.)]|nr:Non-structural maintenance of chromosomes element 1 [Mycena kentingensis (nom. inval.)]